MPERKSRSDSYQWVINETPVDFQSIESAVGNSRSIYTCSHLHPFNIVTNQQFLELNDSAIARIFQLAKQSFTKRQYEIFDLYLQGKTQMEIAKILDVNQSSITKGLMGNVDYNHKGKRYGGMAKRLANLIVRDNVLRNILKEMKILMENLSD